MEEKKNANQASELRDEELERVAGGYSYNGPQLTCSKCGDPFYPADAWQEIYKICLKCDNRHDFAKVGPWIPHS